MLTVAEEVFLLMLDPHTGRFSTELAPKSVHNAVAGALLMDLSLHNRIDTDLRSLFVVDPAPVGEPIADQILALIEGAGDPKPTSFWLDVLAVDGHTLTSELRNSLIAQGIVKEGHDRQLLIAGPPGDGLNIEREPNVRKRISQVLESSELPDPRDIMLISLVNACDLWRGLFREAHYESLGAKIEQLSKMELIGREVARIIRVERSET